MKFSSKVTICQNIKEIFSLSQKTYGSPRITLELHSRGFWVSENTVAKYMQEMNLDARLKKTFRVKTTDSNHDGVIAERVFQAEKDLPTRPFEILAGDITYLKIPGGFMYLSVVMDLWNREIVGWSLDESLSKEGVMSALKKAMDQSPLETQVIFHSDRGSQYASEAFRSLAFRKKLYSQYESKRKLL